MTPLRTRMIEDMKLAGLADKTQEVYQQAVRGLAKHYRRPPDQLSEAEVRRYLLDVREQGAARGTFKTTPSATNTAISTKPFAQLSEPVWRNRYATPAKTMKNQTAGGA